MRPSGTGMLARSDVRRLASSWQHPLSTASLQDIQLVPRWSDFAIEPDTSWSWNTQTFKLPIIPAPMRTIVGANTLSVCARHGVLCPIPSVISAGEFDDVVKGYKDQTVENAAPLVVSVSPTSTAREVMDKIERGATGVFIEAALLATDAALQLVQSVRRESPETLLAAGSFLHVESVRPFVDAGVTMVRVGFGWGTICTSSQLIGVGRAPVPTICEFARELDAKHVAIVVDGGAKQPGDILKALSLGADAVMSGYLFACHADSKFDDLGGSHHYSGSRYASLEGPVEIAPHSGFRVEGRTISTAPKGHVTDILTVLERSIKQGMRLFGSRTVHELREKALFAPLKEQRAPENAKLIECNEWYDG